MEDNKLINSISKLKDPISIEEFINLCLYSNHGYYSNKIVIGKKEILLQVQKFHNFLEKFLDYLFFLNGKKILIKILI